MNISQAMTGQRAGMRWLASLCICSLMAGVQAEEVKAQSEKPLLDGPFVGNVAQADELVSDAAPDQDPDNWKPRRKTTHVGLSAGVAHFNIPCIEGMECRRNGRAITLYAGGEFSKRWGFEFAYMRMSNMSHDGNAVRVRGLNASIVGEMPLTSQLQLTGRVGTHFARTTLDQTVNSNQPSGTTQGLGLSYGAGLNWGVSQNWTASAEWNRHDFKFVTGRDKVDTATLGLRYRY